MQKNLILSFVLALCLFGCAPAGRDVVLTDVAEMADTEEVSDISEALKDLPDSSTGGLTVEEAKEPMSIFVYVCGAVLSPGVYELPEGSRITDAIKAAGGFNGDADETFVNLAARLSDGIKLFIPTREEVADSSGVTGKLESFDEGQISSDRSGGSGSGGLININSATRDELTSIPGIGNATAEKIVSYREQHGSFKIIEDIMNVSGIKDKLFSKIKDYITV